MIKVFRERKKKMILKRGWKKPSIAATGLLLLLCSAGLIGCSSSTKSDIVLQPIESEDIITVKKGQVITAPKDGYFVSTYYLNEIVQAK